MAAILSNPLTLVLWNSSWATFSSTSTAHTQSASDSIAHDQGRKGIFQPLFKNIGEKMVFQPRLQQSLKNSTQVSYTKYILYAL